MPILESAKANKGLLAWIFQHAIEKGYLVPGQTVILDPFGGVGTSAYYALQYQCPVILNELEPHFHSMSRGCDCTGVSKADYAKLFTRPKKLAYKGRRHLCPQCQSELGRITQPAKSEAVETRQTELRQKFQKHRAKLNHYKALAVREYYTRKGLGKPSRLTLKREPMIVDPLPFVQKPQPKQHSLFEIVPPDTLAYERNSGRIPVREAHHYNGNVERWLEIWPGVAYCLQGDSTKLASIIASAGLSISSPPFVNVLSDHPSESIVKGGLKMGQSSMGDGYGSSPNQLGAMPAGTLSLSSPTFPTLGSDDPDKRGGILTSDPKRKEDKNLTGTYGDSEGQMGVMSVGSPPFAQAQTGGGIVKDENDKRNLAPSKVGGYQSEMQGQTEGQLSALSLGSPPFADNPAAWDKLAGNKDGQVRANPRHPGEKLYFTDYAKQESPDNLANLPSGALSLGSPSWAGNSGGQTEAARNGIDPGIFDRHQGGMKGGTGSSEGNLDRLPMTVSSPPYLNETLGHSRGEAGKKRDEVYGPSIATNYGTSPDQLGNTNPRTFWEASELIIRQLYQILPSGSASIWIVKDFIQSGRRVEFAKQWTALCEHCGFRLAEWINAYQVSEVAQAQTLEGQKQTITKGGVSFFRGLVNNKHKQSGRDDLVIESEVVVILVRE